jgi:hypothetical protein
MQARAAQRCRCRGSADWQSPSTTRAISAVTRVCSVGLPGISAAPEGSFWSMPWQLGCLQRPPVARHCLTGLRACVPRGGERHISWYPARGGNYPAACPLPILAEPVPRGASGRPLASPRVRLAAQDPPLRPVAAQPALSASSRMPLRPGSRFLASSAVHGPQSLPPTTARSARPDAPGAGRGARRAGRSSQ